MCLYAPAAIHTLSLTRGSMMKAAVPLVTHIHKITFLHHFSLPDFGESGERRGGWETGCFLQVELRKTVGKNLYVHPDTWLSSLLSHRAFLSRDMVGSFSQRLGNGGRKSEQKPLILCFLGGTSGSPVPVSQLWCGTRGLMQQHRHPSDACQREKEIASDRSTGNNMQAWHLPLPLGRGLEREMRPDGPWVEPWARLGYFYQVSIIFFLV